MITWPFVPQSGIEETMEWKTDIIRSRQFEQRIQTRAYPDQIYKMTFMLTREQYARATMIIGSDQPVILPLWTDYGQRQSLAAGSFVVPQLVSGLRFIKDLHIVIYEHDKKIHTSIVNSVTGGPAFDDATTEAFNDFYYMPGLLCNFDGSPDAAVYNNDFMRLTVRFRFNQDYLNVFPFGSNYPYSFFAYGQASYNGKPLIDFPSEIKGSLSESHSRQYQRFKNVMGRITHRYVYDQPDRQSQLLMTLLSRSEILSARSMITWMSGQLESFWMPTFEHDLTPLAPIAVNDTAFSINIPEINADNLPSHAAFITSTGIQVREITYDETTGKINLDSDGILYDATLDDRVSFVYLSRLSTDRVTIHHYRHDYASMSLGIVTTHE